MVIIIVVCILDAFNNTRQSTTMTTRARTSAVGNGNNISNNNDDHGSAGSNTGVCEKPLLRRRRHLVKSAFKAPNLERSFYAGESFYLERSFLSGEEFQSSGAGEEFLQLFCRAESGIKGMIFHRHR